MIQPVHERLEPAFKLVSFGDPWSAPQVVGSAMPGLPQKRISDLRFNERAP